MVSPWSMMLAEDLGIKPVVSSSQCVGRRKNELLFRNSLRQCSMPCSTCFLRLWSFKCLTHSQRPFAPHGTMSPHRDNWRLTSLGEMIIPSSVGYASPLRLWLALSANSVWTQIVAQEKKSQPHAQDHSLPRNKRILGCNSCWRFALSSYWAEWGLYLEHIRRGT